MKTRRLLSGIAAVSTVFVATSAWQRTGSLRGGGSVQAQVSQIPAPPLRPVWSEPVANFRAAALAPDGAFFGVLTGDGNVSLWKRGASKPLWTQAVPGASQVTVSADGRYVLAYAALDPTQKTLTLLQGRTGAVVSQKPLDGAVWDVTLSPDGQSAGVVTGSHSLYLYNLDNAPRFHRWALPGIGNSVAIARNNAFLAAGTWDQSGVTCYTRAGQALWQYPADTPTRSALMNRLFDVEIAQDGHAILGISYGNVRGAGGRLYLWPESGRSAPRWTHDFGDDTFFPKAEITANGQYVAATYVQRVQRGEQVVNEHRLLLLDSDGKPVWDPKGGLLFAPTLAALTSDAAGPRVIISDGQRTLYALNVEGRTTDHCRLGGQIRQAIPAPDSRSLLVYTGDGMLTLFPLV